MPLLRNLKLKGIRIIVLKNTHVALISLLLGCLVLAGGFFINPVKDVKNASLILSKSSEIFAQGRIVGKADPIEVCGKNSFVIRNSSHILFAANRSIAQVYGSIYEDANPTLTQKSFAILNRSNNAYLAIFNSSDGNWYISGKAVYQNASAGCMGYYCCRSHDLSGPCEVVTQCRAICYENCNVTTGNCERKLIYVCPSTPISQAYCDIASGACIDGTIIDGLCCYWGPF